MLYLSQLLGAPVEDPQGIRIGKIIDMTINATRRTEPTYIDALLVEGSEDRTWRVPRQVVTWQHDAAFVHVPTTQLSLQADSLPAGEISLAHDVLDKQVIDVVHKKAVRVNDICLGDDWQLMGIDNSGLGLLRRLTPNWLPGAKSLHASSGIIPWQHIELIAPQEEEQESGEERPHVTRPTSGQLAELRPADIAEIVDQLTPVQGARLIERLDDETAAHTMEEIDTARQRHILENILPTRAADILEAMGPDEAADLLAQLPEERAQELLKLMTPEESEDVQELLEYEADSAGGLMTTDYIVLDQAKSAAQALDAVRSQVQQQDVHAAYVYCVADAATAAECPLLGVISLWELLVASPDQRLQDLMETDLITVLPDSDPLTVAQIMAKYNLLAVPVVNKELILEGVVTVDDVLDILLPADKRRKPTRMY